MPRSPAEQISHPVCSVVPGIRCLIFDRQRSCGCRLFWAVALLLSTVGFVWCASSLYARMVNRPIVVSLSERAEPIWDVPFPAITICPEIKARVEYINFTDTYHRLSAADKLTVDHRQNMLSLLQLCDPHMSYGLDLEEETHAADNLTERLLKMALPLDDTILVCRVNNQIQTDLRTCFSEVWTEEGLCFTYNSLNSAELYRDNLAANFPHTPQHNRSAPHWRSHTGYTNAQAANATYPARALSAGARAGLVVILHQLQEDIDYLCRGPTQGFKVFVHAPDEAPNVWQNFFRVSREQETRVTVHPVVTETSECLRRYDSARRQCYFDDEKPLQFFRSYTQRNCEIECLSEYLLRKCGCTRFSLPRNESAPVCGASKIKCMAEAENEQLVENMMDGVTNSQTDCNCLPACTNVGYNIDVSSGDLNWKEMHNAFNAKFDENLQMSRLTVMFKESHFTPTKRYELYSNAELIALAGGLLALFFGASLLSGMKFVYVLVWRHCWRGPIDEPKRFVQLSEFNE